MFTKIGRLALLDFLLSDPTVNAQFCLTSNNPIPADADVTLADITEATFGGYARKTGVVFPSAIINTFAHGETISLTQTWTASGATLPQTIYAAYILMTFTATDFLCFFRRFGSPIVLMNPGDLVEKKFDMLDDDSNVAAFG